MNAVVVEFEPTSTISVLLFEKLFSSPGTFEVVVDHVPDEPPEALPTRVMGEAPITENGVQETVPEHETDVVATPPNEPEALYWSCPAEPPGDVLPPEPVVVAMTLPFWSTARTVPEGLAKLVIAKDVLVAFVVVELRAVKFWSVVELFT